MTSDPSHIPDDQQLLALICDGSESAFEQLYRKYWKRLYAYTYRIFQDEQACEDMVQDVFVKLWLSEAKHQIRNIESYLFKAVRYKAANSIRDLKWGVDFDEVLHQVMDELDAESSLELKEVQSQIQETMQSLPQKCREVFVLFHDEGLSVNEIATKLGISSRTVETHIYNARQILRSRLSKTALLVALFSDLFC